MDWKELFRDLKRSEEKETPVAKENEVVLELAKEDEARRTWEKFAPCVERVSWEFIKTFAWRFGGGHPGPLSVQPITFSLSDETTWVGPKGLDYCEKSITLALDADGSTLAMMGTCITGTRTKDNQEIRCTKSYAIPARKLKDEELAKTMVEVYKEIEAVRRMYFTEYDEYKKRHNVTA